MNNNQQNNSSDTEIRRLENKAISVSSALVNDFQSEIKEIESTWEIFNGEFNSLEYDYLTKPDGKHTYPAKIRDIGSEIIRNKIHVLISEQSRRSFRFSSSVIDERSKEEKYKKRIENLLKAVESTIDDSYDIVLQSISSVNNQISDLENQVNAAPESMNEEQQNQLNQIKQNLPLIRLEYNKMLRQLNNQKIDMEQVKAKINYYNQFNEIEIVELLCKSFIKSKLAVDLREHYDSGMTENIVSGRPSFLVDYNERTEKVVFKKLESSRTFYFRNSSQKYTDLSEACGYIEYLSPSELMSQFSMTEKEVLSIYSVDSYNNSGLMSVDGDGAIFMPKSINEIDSVKGIKVMRVWWLEPRTWMYKESPNKKRPGAYFYNLTLDNKKKPDEKINTHTLFDRYSAVIINDTHIKNVKKDNYVLRMKDNPAIPLLPIVAYSYNSIEKPYSIIKRVKSLRELYNVVLYNIELTIALSGVKGMVMDKTQKPDDMTTREWQYYRKMGTFWIESQKKGRKPSSFNQFQTYDDTLSQSISTSFELLKAIESMIGNVMGISGERVAQTVAKEAVANASMNREQSSLITEILFYNYDRIFARALSQYCNLCFQYELKNGKVINYFDEQLQEVLFKIPENTLNNSDFSINVNNNLYEDQKIENIRQLIINKMPLNAITPLMRIDTLIELEKRLEQIVNDENQRQQDNAIALERERTNREQQLQSIKTELENKRLELDSNIQQIKIEVEKEKLLLDKEHKQWLRSFEEAKFNKTNDNDLLATMSENDIESGYLEETQRHNIITEKLEEMRLNLEGMINAESLRFDKYQADQKHKVEIKKANTNKTRTVNNVKD